MTGAVGAGGRIRPAVAALAAPLAWFAHLNVSYLLVPYSCRSGSNVALHLTTVVAALAAMAGGILATRLWRAGGAVTRPLLPEVTMLLSPLFVLAILLTGASNLVIDPCG